MKLTLIVFLIILYFLNSYQVNAQINDEGFDEREIDETDSTSRFYLNEIRGFHENDEEYGLEQTNEDPSDSYLYEGYETNEGEL